jgi:flagellar biosynthesis/type III secretory pathway protein FliH
MSSIQTSTLCKNCEDTRGATEALQEQLKEATETARDLGYLKGFADGLESAVKTYREMWRFHCEWELKLTPNLRTP